MSDGKLLSGQSLPPEDTLVSVGGHARLHYQGDGNLVVYLDGEPYWASHTDGYTAGRLQMDRNGNLVVYDSLGPIASTRTHGHPGAMVQLQDDGNFVVYEDPQGPNAGTPIWASSTGAFVIGECVVSPEPIVEFLPPLQGVVDLIDGGRGGLRDASGRRLAVGKHAGDFIARIINDPNGKAVVSAALDYLRANGVHFLRTWFFLPGTWWATPPRPGNADPSDPRWEPAVRWYCAELNARGLYLLADGGDFFRQYPTQGERIPAARRWGQILASTGVNLFGVGMGNEAWQNGESYDATPESVERMTECLRSFESGFGRKVPISTLTSVRDEGLLNDYVRGTSAPTVISYHGTRGPYRHAVERAWTAAYADNANATEPKMRSYLLDDEPAGINSKDGAVGSGPGCHVSATSPSDMAIWRDLEAYGTYMVAHLVGRQTPVILTSTGIISDEPFSVYPQIAHVAKLAAMLPKDVQSWKQFHGGDGRDFSHLRILSVDDAHNNHLVRCDHALNEQTGEVVVTVYCTQPGTYRLPVISGFEGVILTPDATLSTHPLTLTAGASIDVSMNYGRILIGRRR